MRHFWLGAAALAAMLLAAASAHAGTLMYSFENGDSPNNLDGFTGNGIPASDVTQSNIGVTDGLNSMSNTIPAGATFVGALTATVAAPLNSPSTTAL